MSTTMLDLNDVAIFVQVVRCGSFAEAARRLGVPPNTLSRRVQQLEAQLGTRLMQRSTRHLTLTNAGQVFLERCSGAVEGLMDAGEELLAVNQEPSGLVRVAAPADFFDFFAMEWLTEFLAAHPKVLDAGNDGLVASPAYVARQGVPDTLQDLADHDCLVFSHPSGKATWRVTGPDGAQAEVQVAGRFSGNTAQALRKAALAGLGIALLPSTLTRRDLRAGLLVPVLPQYHRQGHGVHMVYPSRRYLPLAVSAFMELVISKMGAMQELPPQTCGSCSLNPLMLLPA